MINRYLVAVLATFSPAVFAGLPTGLSGAWYNPAQSGHGVHLEMLSGESAAGTWSVFDHAGNPLTLYFEASVENGRLVADAYAPRGMKFGSFDRTQFTVPRWGTLEFEFADCDHGTLSYDGDGPAGASFGVGAIPLQRLTRIAGTACSFDVLAGQSVVGVYEGHWEPAFDDVDDLEAAVDPEGRLWATTKWTPGPTFVRAVGHPPVIIGEPIPSHVDFSTAGARVRYNSAMATSGTPVAGQPVQVSMDIGWRSDGRLGISAYTSTIPTPATSFDLASVPGASALSSDGFSPSSLAGRKFRFLEVWQFGEANPEVRFDALGGICIPENHITTVCDYVGQIVATEPGLSMFDFTLHPRLSPATVYGGKGWIRNDTGRLVLVGASGERGLGLVGVPWN